MSEVPTTSYDEVPYGDNVFCYTRPECLGAVAALLGMRPAPADRCDVLELGCGTGGNLIPMAQDLPGSRFVGIDLSARQIDSGRQVVTALGLTNIELRPLSILDVDERFGPFDYVICHGVYSWVPAEVRDKILSVCKAHLAPDGVAYVSYNTYPGWHLRGMIRDMMGFHVRQFDDPRERVGQARALLHFLAQTVGARNTLYGGLLQVEADLLDKASDTYLYHEHLEEVNSPIYFHQFAERAGAKGLQYVAEAQPSALAQNLSAEARETLGRMSGSLVRAEQYLDFVRNRTFRRTLLCHDQVRLRRPPAPERVASLYLTGLVEPVGGGGDAAAPAAEEFRTPDGTSLRTNHPALRAALRCLSDAWPAALAFGDLWDGVRARLPQAGGEGARLGLAEALLQCYLSKVVELHSRPPGLAVDPGERPRGSPLARLQAASGRPLSNLRHRNVTLDPFDLLVLQQLDGTRDRATLVEALAGLAADGLFGVEHDGRAVGDPGRVRDALRQSLDGSLHRIARSALLVAA